MKLEAKQRLVSCGDMLQYYQDLENEGKEVSAKIGPIKKGAFHKWLGKSEDEPITDADIAKGKASDSEHVRKMAQFAENARKWKHK